MSSWWIVMEEKPMAFNCTVPPLYIHVTTKNKITNERTNRCWMISNYKSEKKPKKLKDKFKKGKILGILARISLFLENISTDYKPSSIYSPIEYRLNKGTNIYLKGFSCSWCKKKKKGFPVHLARSALFLHTILIQTIYM